VFTGRNQFPIQVNAVDIVTPYQFIHPSVHIPAVGFPQQAAAAKILRTFITFRRYCITQNKEAIL
jgi:hypothetical protein